MGKFGRSQILTYISNLCELEMACLDLFLNDQQRKAVELLIKIFVSRPKQAALTHQDKLEMCQAQYEFARSKQTFEYEISFLESLADLLNCTDAITKNSMDEFKLLFTSGYYLHSIHANLLAVCCLQVAFSINLEDEACDQLLTDCFSDLKILRYPKSYYKAMQEQAKQEADSLLITESEQEPNEPVELSDLIATCNELTEQDQPNKIIEMILAIPDEQRTPEMWSELGRAYNNLGRTKEDGTEYFKKALSCLLPYSEQLSQDHCWNYRVGFAYFYLDMPSFALPFFEDALLYRPDDPDTQDFINCCRHLICLPTFSKPFSSRVQNMWQEFSEQEQEWRDELNQETVYYKTLLKVSEQIGAIFTPFVSELTFNPHATTKRCTLSFRLNGATKFVQPLYYMVRQAPEDVRSNWTVSFGFLPRKMTQHKIEIQGKELDLDLCQVKVVESKSLELQDIEQSSNPTTQDGADQVQFCTDPNQAPSAASAQDQPTSQEQPKQAKQARQTANTSPANEDMISMFADNASLAAISQQDDAERAHDNDELNLADMHYKYVVLIYHPVVAQLAKEVDKIGKGKEEILLNLYCEALINVVSQLIGEKAMLFALQAIRISKLESSFNNAEGEVIPLADLSMRMEQLGYDLYMHDEQFIQYHRTDFKRDLKWTKCAFREDIYRGWTYNNYLFSEYYVNDCSYVDFCNYHGICVGFFAFKHKLEQSSSENIPPARTRLLRIFNRMFRGDPNLVVIGNAYGLKYDYIDIMAFDNIADTLTMVSDYMKENPELASFVYFAPFRPDYRLILHETDTKELVENVIKDMAAEIDAMFADNGTEQKHKEAPLADEDAATGVVTEDQVSLVPVSAEQVLEAEKKKPAKRALRKSDADSGTSTSKGTKRSHKASHQPEQAASAASTVSTVIEESESAAEPAQPAKAAKATKATKASKATKAAAAKTGTKRKAKKSAAKDATGEPAESQAQAPKAKAATKTKARSKAKAKTSAADTSANTSTDTSADESAGEDIISAVITDL